MKKFLTFILFTMGLLALTGFYLWFNLHRDVEAITYVPHTEWSAPQVVPSVNSSIYDAKADDQGQLHVVWVETTNDNDTRICYTVMSPTGQPLFPAKTLLTNSDVQALALDLSQEQVHLFWVGMGRSEMSDLFWSEFDANGQLIQQKTLLTNHYVAAEDLTIVHGANGARLLAWTDVTWTGQRLQTLHVSSNGTVHTTTITAPNETAHTPRLVVDDQHQYHLVWRKETNRDWYELIYQPLTATGAPIGSLRVMDQGEIGLAAITVRGGQVYLAWEKANPDFAQSKLIYGAIVDTNRPLEPVTPTLLSKTDSSNYAPNLGWDEHNHLRLVYAKWKDDYKSLVSQSYERDFTQIVSNTRWMYPQFIQITSVKVATDPGHRLYVTCLETQSDNQTVLHYINSFQTEHITPWQIIGLNSRDYMASLRKDLVFIIFGPGLNMFVFTFYFISVVCIIITSFIMAFLRNRFYFTKWAKLSEHFYLNFAVLCITQIFLIWAFLQLLQYEMPMELMKHHFWWIYGVSTAATIVYSLVNRVHKTEVMYASILCFAWLYWVWVIQLTLNIANLNFVVPPMI